MEALICRQRQAPFPRPYSWVAALNRQTKDDSAQKSSAVLRSPSEVEDAKTLLSEERILSFASRVILVAHFRPSPKPLVSSEEEECVRQAKRPRRRHVLNAVSRFWPLEDPHGVLLGFPIRVSLK